MLLCVQRSIHGNYRILGNSGNSSDALFKKSEEVLRNATVLLDEFLRGYDRRLRPGFGG